MVESARFRSLALYHAPSPVAGSVLEVLVIMNVMPMLSASIFSACFGSSRSACSWPSCLRVGVSTFSRWMLGVMSGVLVTTLLDSRGWPSMVSVHVLGTSSATAMRLHWR